MSPEEHDLNERFVAFLEGKHYRYARIDGEGNYSQQSCWMTEIELKLDFRWIGPDIEIWDIEHIRNGILRKVNINTESLI